jgi:hypothetical protein
MNSLIKLSDRTTHIKIVVVFLIASIVFVAVGINARVSNEPTQTVVIKAGAPTNYTDSRRINIR